MKEKIINWLIKVTKADTNEISDGYHTFAELYKHRCVLFNRLCSLSPKAWRSRKHSDGTVWDGWFIMGINERKGTQITYHLPEDMWFLADRFNIPIRKKAPVWDGHTPNDVIKRLEKLKP